MMKHRPPARLLRSIAKLQRKTSLSPSDERQLSDAQRKLLRAYRDAVSRGDSIDKRWRKSAIKALSYLGADADRQNISLKDYDHHRFGPFLGVSDDGYSGDEICQAALASPKAQALWTRASTLGVGLALDAERLAGVGELAVGPDEFFDIWLKCAGRSLLTTNIGSRVNVRHYLPAPVITIREGHIETALAAANTKLEKTFEPFLKTPNQKPRPLVVYVQFKRKSAWAYAKRKFILNSVIRHIRSGKIADPRVHKIGISVQIGWGAKGRAAAIKAIDFAGEAGLEHVLIDGVVRKVADRAISHPGLLNYLPPTLADQVLRHAKNKGIFVRSIKQVDPDTVARSIWPSLNTARGMGVHLGKYGLFPLTLEESEIVVRQVQQWFQDWTTAPVFYVDQGLVTRKGIFVEEKISKGIEIWLRAMSKHRVEVVLIDTVDKAKGSKILRSSDNPKGLLSLDEVAKLTDLGDKLGIRILWAGSITEQESYEFGRLGVFGIYVTTAAAVAAPVRGKYNFDDRLASIKKPTLSGVLNVKTLLEAGFLSERVNGGEHFESVQQVKLPPTSPDAAAELSRILPAAWRKWWRSIS
jgi:hypothetical protein